jgi:DNA-binding NtrC family response regulator
MNSELDFMSQTNRNTVEQDFDKIGSRKKVPTPPGFPLKIVSSQRSKRSSDVEIRFVSLRVLALSLLDQIEALEDQDGEIPRLNLQEQVHEFEATLIRNALARTRGRQRQAARLLGVKASTLNAKIKRHKIDLEDNKERNEA